MRKTGWWCVVVFWGISGLPAFPHALHPESIDRYVEFTLTPTQLAIVYEIILGLNPTQRAARRMDPDNDGKITDAERDAFVRFSADQYAPKQTIRIGEWKLTPRFVTGDAYHTIGHNMMNVIKIDLGYLCPVPAEIPRGVTLPFFYEDGNWLKVPGWKQMNFFPRDGVAFTGHIPYQEFNPFDYMIIETKGFIPATNSLSLEVNLPSAPAGPGDFTVSLPPKAQYDAGSSPPGSWTAAVWLGGAFLVLVAMGGGVVWMLRSRMMPPDRTG
ncbi:MAG TPA: hypothetical protein PLH79_18935 [bacterium]|nr:hypothetical protein [Candidatus Omnitrophota bacterium]HOL96427.1 hypothetical protein [bacterium]HPP02246.1 hypothetical protein [bacterium]HXK95983.1 hypothetical protein [bacterium]